MVNISPLHATALRRPNAIALRFNPSPNAYDQEGLALSYRELSRRVLQLGQRLKRQGLEPGARLGCVSGNGLEAILLYWACVDNGFLFCPLSPRLPPGQIRAMRREFALTAIWYEPAAARGAADLSLGLEDEPEAQGKLSPPVIDAGQAVNIIFTSGSSGKPKAAVHSLNNHIASAAGARSLIPLAPGDSWLLSLPLFHIGGLAILNRCALAGACIALPDPRLSLAGQIRRDAISHLSLVPTQLWRLLLGDADGVGFDPGQSSLKALLLGGGPMTQALLDALARSRLPAFCSYGMTEMSSQITTGQARADGNSGSLLPYRQLKLVDGVIWVRGETLFLGYLQAGKVCKELDDQGWFCSGDRGLVDGAGRLRLLGRVDNQFICGGENIQPEEIENALRLHPAIEEAIVFGEADAEFGLLPSAIIRGELPDPAELQGFLQPRIAGFKRPRRYYPWPELADQGSLKLARKRVIATVLKAKPPGS
ncbi:AMP-binding protein [Shewanella salipaludis]|uniref:AMP-binding protein n=1 Tax=Shewanella salipaludis TaxID=2723052 RepID=A0A972FST1_9GAMM|nr:AMP-binding protein [Shewanella salipaludis]NMH65052.1 AMP-binding protein [Shewanella salipaludis]